MTDSTPQAPQLDDRLAEIDRKLREIQGELAPAVGGEPDGSADVPPAPDQGASPPAQQLDDQIARLTALHTSLLSSVTEVLAQLQAALSQVRHSEGSELSISAGPFASLEEVHAFERELARLPVVREVTVRGYEGDDRAVIVVQLSRPTT